MAPGITRIAHGPTFETWRGKGELHLDWTTAGGLRLTIDDHGDGEFGKCVVAAMQAHKDRFGTVTLFGDFSRMHTYDTAVRSEVTSWLVSNRAAMVRVHAIASSRLTVMGITVASLVLGDMLVHHKNTADFDREAAKHGFVALARKSA